jgi:hypothetical protein
MRRPATAGLVLLAFLAGLTLAPWPVAPQSINHKATATTSPPRIGAPEWNASMAVTGGTDGQVFLRDSTATDGWRFGSLTAGSGGTGHTTYAVGDLLAANSTTTLARLAAVADGNVLRSAGVSTSPVWGKVRLDGATTDITGTLAVVNGGTGQFTYTIGDLLYADGSTSLARLTAVADGSVLRSAGVGAAPIYGKVRLSGATTDITGTLPATSGGSGFASYAVGDLLYADTTTTLAKLADVATGNALLSGGVSTAPAWGKIGLTTHVSGTLAVANGGTGVGTFTTDGVLYGNGTGVILVTAQGGTNTVLTANAGAPSFSATPTLTSLTLSGLTQGSIVFAGASGALSQDNANLFFDDSANNLRLYGGTVGTNGVKVLTLGGPATPPTTSPADSVQLWVEDRNGAGTADLRFRNEEGHTGSALAWTLVGKDDTERTCNNSAAELSRVSGINIPVGEPFMLVAKVRKTSGAAAASQMRLDINGLAGTNTKIALGNITSATNQAEDGIIYLEWGFPGATNYTNSIGELIAVTGPAGGARTRYTLSGMANAMPTAAITSISLVGISGNAAITLATHELRVYRLAGF